MALSRSIEYTHLDDLLLDPLNPRLGRRAASHPQSQEALLEIIRGWDVEELAVSFIENGFWPQEALVVLADPSVDESRLTVVEGNRRLGALKLLQSAAAGAPRTRKWRELAEQLPDDHELFARVPYLRAEHRDDVREYLGFRHVTGIKEWAPAEKARYIADLIDSGFSYEHVMRTIGSTTPTVRRNYLAYNILRQLDDLDDVDPELVENRFSVLFLSLREQGIQDFLGVDPLAAPEDAQQPIREPQKLANLGHFVRWVFGTATTPPLFSDSRFVTKFARILESPDAVSYLIDSPRPSLAAAASKAGADTDELVERLKTAVDQIEQALSTVHLYSADEAVQAEVTRLVKGVGALLRSFPSHEATLRAPLDAP